METQTKKLIIFLVLPLLLAAALINYQNWQISKSIGFLTVEFFDIGQGDSFLITTINGNQILVDAGPGSSVLGDLASAMPQFDKQIEMIVISHPHSDHIEGFIEVFKRYDVKKVLLPNVEFNSPPYEEFLRLMDNEKAEIIYAQQGQRLVLDEGTVLDILYPLSQTESHPKESADVNDSSIVAMLMFGRSKFMLTGDSGVEIEALLINNFNLDSDVLKVGHHGSKYSTSQSFLDKVTPEYAVIQVGKNNYGHPAKEVLDRLNLMNIQTFRNDQSGSIEFKSDGFTVYKTE